MDVANCTNIILVFRGRNCYKLIVLSLGILWRSAAVYWLRNCSFVMGLVVHVQGMCVCILQFSEFYQNSLELLIATNCS